MIVAGAPVGYLLGHAARRPGGVVAARRGRRRRAQPGGPCPYALLALLGALGGRPARAAPVAAPSRSSTCCAACRGRPARWRSVVVEVLVVALAVVGDGAAAGRPAGLTGVALLVPGLVVVAVALVAARAFAPGGRRAGPAPRCAGAGSGLGLAAVQIARRPGSQRLFVLLAVASALLAFVAAGIDVAARARDDRARIMTGATRVLTVDQADVRRLLHVTRAVDPEGAWAMAAMPVEQADAGGPAGARGRQRRGWPRWPRGDPSSARRPRRCRPPLRPPAGAAVHLPRHPAHRRPGDASPLDDGRAGRRQPRASCRSPAATGSSRPSPR